VSRAAAAALAAVGFTAVVASAAPRPAPAVAPARPVAVGTVTVRVRSGASATVPVTVRLAPLPRRADVVVLLDTSTSMTLPLPDVRRQVAAAVRSLAAGGYDLRVGLALAGTSPVKYRNTAAGQQAPYGDPQNADPATDPGNPAYRPPVLFRRVLPVSPVPAFLAALDAVRPEVLPSSSDTGLVFERLQAQLLSVDQLLTGSGFAGSPDDRFQDAVAPGQVAGWRDGADVARLVVSVTDQELDAPDGTPALAAVTARLAAQRVRHVGLMVMGYRPGVAGLAALSAAAGTYVPAGGLRCGGYAGDEVVPAGAPFVCNTTRTALAVETAVRSVPHDAPFALASASADPVLRGVAGARRTLDAAVPHTLAVPVTVACPAAAVETRHALPLAATYGPATGTGTLTVVCAAAEAVPGPVPPDAVPPAAVPPGPVPPAVAAVPAPPPAPPAPPANPNLQPAGQPGPQAAVNAQQETRVETAEEQADDARPGDADQVAFWLGAAAALTGAAAAYARRTATAAQAARRTAG
jgi:hypothetical protein